MEYKFWKSHVNTKKRIIFLPKKAKKNFIKAENFFVLLSLNLIR